MVPADDRMMTSAGSRLLVGTIVLLACLQAAVGASGATPSVGPVAVTARTCKPPHYPSIGYFNAVAVTGTSCSTGNRLVLAYFKCRTRSGLAGRCRARVLGFKCTEVRQSIPTEIDAQDTCRHGHKTVVSAWQQDLG